jgi:hypothetical protein
MMHQKGDVHYTDQAKGRDHCSICVHYQPRTGSPPATRCAVVVGIIKPMGWCTEFKHHLESAAL